MGVPLATPDDVAQLWRPLSSAEQQQVEGLIVKASARLRHAAPFDIDTRIALYSTDPTALTALDPDVVADVIATKVKNFLVNPDGVASGSETAGPFSKSATYVNRYDKTGSDIRGSLEFTDSDLDQLRPAVPADSPFAFQIGIPDPQLLIPAGNGFGVAGRSIPVVVPDVFLGSGVE